MRTPAALRNLDDRVLGRHGRPARRGDRHDDVYPAEPGARTDAAHEHDDSSAGRDRRPAGDVLREVLGVVWTVSRYVFLALAALAVLGIVLDLAPTNDDNTLVSSGLSAAEWAAGPFRDVFTPDGENLRVVVNYGLAAGVYLIAASVMARLPGRRGARD